MGRPRVWQPITKICEECDEKFEAKTAYQIRDQRFCDRYCRSASAGNGKRKTFKKKCEWCDFPMDVWPSKPKRFCSTKCRFAWAKEYGERAGANNPAWKGGTGNRGAYWKKKARERDDFTCQMSGCGKRAKGRSTHAHHKIPRDAGGSDTLDNLITLCSVHHASIERDLLTLLTKKYPKATAKIALKIFDNLKPLKEICK